MPLILLVCLTTLFSGYAGAHGLSPPNRSVWAIEGVTRVEYRAHNFFGFPRTYEVKVYSDRELTTEHHDYTVLPKQVLLGPMLGRNITVFVRGIDTINEAFYYVCTTPTAGTQAQSAHIVTRVCSKLSVLPKPPIATAK